MNLMFITHSVQVFFINIKQDLLDTFHNCLISFAFFHMVAVCNEIDQWPSPLPGLTLNLPLMGVVLQVKVSIGVVL